MRVSVITVCFNSEETLEDTLQSVTSQDYKDLEYIIIDGGSTDGTLGIIDRYKDKISKFLSEPDEGMYHALNKGIALATGDVVGILNSDDIYTDSGVISQVAGAMDKSGADSLYGNLVYVNRENTDVVMRYWHSGEYKDGIFKKGWMPPHPAFFLKREAYLKHGSFDTRLKTAADYELMLRMLHKHKVSTFYLPKVLVKMRVGGVSNENVKNRVEANKEDRLAWKYNDLKPGMLTFILKPVRKIGQWFARPPK